MRNRALTYTLGFIAFGILITFLILYVQRKTVSTYEYDLAYKSLGDHTKQRVTVAQLAFERYLAGDNGVNRDRDIIANYTYSHELLQAAYDGKTTGLGEFEKTKDEETKALLKEAVNDTDRLAEIVKTIFNERQAQVNLPDTAAVSSVIPDNEAGKKFDTAHKRLITTLDRLIIHINKKIEIDSVFLNTISWLSVIVLVVIFVSLSLFLYRFQGHSDKFIFETEKRLELQAGTSHKIADFIEAVSAGNYEVELELEGDESNLTNKLITMRDKLKENTENDRRRSWSTMGLAQIGELLRVTNDNASELYDNIIKFIVKYTKSNQGGLFIINEQDTIQNKTYLELVSCYAFERKKFLTKSIEPGEGLVGQCFMEGQRIYLVEVPDEYVAISSGLGGAKPKALLIVPMLLNGKVYGVIEVATFGRYEDFEIELLEKLAENIASTISIVRTNESTRILLETTQQQSEEMKAQEEEIRQNMEELEATQEEMRRKQTLVERELIQSQEQMMALQAKEKRLTDSQDALQAIVDNIPRAIFWKDKDLRFNGCNKIFAKVAGLASTTDIIGKSDFDMPWSDQAEAYRKDDEEVMNSREGKLNIEEVNINSDGNESWVLTSKVPIVNAENEVIAILGMFEDITDRKHKEADVAIKLEERKQALQEIADLKTRLQQQR